MVFVLKGGSGADEKGRKGRRGRRKREKGKVKSITEGRESILRWIIIIGCINGPYNLNHQITQCMVQLIKKGVP